jgi:phage protein D
MTPAFKFVMGGKDLTARLNKRLLNLTVTDEAGIKSDTFELTLDDTPPHIDLPTRGQKVVISLGYLETGLVTMGTYEIDEVEVSGSPDQIRISGKATSMSGGIKTRRTKGHSGKTFKQIVTEIAARHDLTPVVDDELADLSPAHVAQTNESDMHFLTRLAEDNGGVFKVADGKAVFAKRDRVKSVSGKTVHPVTVTMGQNVLSWRLATQSRGHYAQVTARYHDYKTGQLIDVTVGKSGASSRTLTKRYASEAEARRAANAEADRLKRGTGTLTLDIVGNARVAAEGRLTTVGFRPGVNGTWRMKSVKHTLDSGGFKTSIETETPKDSKS